MEKPVQNWNCFDSGLFLPRIYCFADFQLMDGEGTSNFVEKKEEEDKDQELVNIHWYACEGTELNEKEVEDLEDFFDLILNDEFYFDDSDAWVMEIMLFEILMPKDMNYLF